MTIPRSWLLTLAIIAAVVLWMLSGALFAPEIQATEVASATAGPLQVRVQVSSAQPMTNRLILQGQTQADRTVTVKAETNGVVRQVLVDKGTRVERDDTLLKLAVEEREVGAHRGERARVVVAAQALDEGPVRDAEPEDESALG